MKRWVIPPVGSDREERILWVETRIVYEARFGYVRPEEVSARVGERNAEKYRRRFSHGRPVRPTEAKLAQIHGGRGEVWIVEFDGECRIAGASLAGVDRVPVAVRYVDPLTLDPVDLPDGWEIPARRAIERRAS